MKNVLLIFLALMALTTTSFAQKKAKKQKFHYSHNFASLEEIEKEELKIKRVYMTLCGHYGNEAQAKALQHPAYQAQELVLIPILQKKRQGEYWFYLAWFTQGQHARALGEGICKLEKYNRDTFLLKTYPLSNTPSLEWQKSDAFEYLNIKEVTSKGGCESFIVEKKPGLVEMRTETLCPHVLSDHIHYHRMNMDYHYETIYGFSSFFGPNQEIMLEYPKDMPTDLRRMFFPEYALKKKKKK